MRKAVLQGSVAALVLGSMCLVSPLAVAQDTTAEEAENPLALNQITVTARKVEESILDAPIAVTAFDSAELIEGGFDNILDIGKASPGLFVPKLNSFPQGRLNTTPRFRGIFLLGNDPLQRTAGTFVDGIAIINGLQSIGVQELERVEVIKGPQSALFGRNTFAGAVNYVTRDPGEKFGGTISALAASRDEYNVSASVEGPILSKALSGRINGSYNFNGGHFDNAAVEGQELGEEETWTVSGALLFEPNDRFRSTLRGTYFQDRDGPVAAQAVGGVATHNFGGFPFIDAASGVVDLNAPFDGIPPSGELGTLQTETAFQGTISSPELDEIGLNTGDADFETLVNVFNGLNADSNVFPGLNPFERDGFGLSRNAFRVGSNSAFNITENISVSLLAGYNEDDIAVVSDFDVTGDASFTNTYSRSIRDFSVEGRLSGEFDNILGRPLNWTLGGTYVDIDIDELSGTLNLFGPQFFFAAFVDDDVERTGAQTLAGFGILDYEIVDKLNIIFEWRYQRDEIFDPSVNGVLGADVSPATFTTFLPRVVAQYQPYDDTLLYFNWGVGNLPGGFNAQVAALNDLQLAELQLAVPTAATTFDEERLENFEIGWKQSLFNDRAYFSLAAFYMERTDQIFQFFELVSTVGVTDPASDFITVEIDANGASTEIFGFELEAEANLTENLFVQGSVAYVDSEISDFPTGAACGDFCDIFGSAASPVGQEAPRFPPLTASIGARFEDDLPKNQLFESWYARGDVFYTDSFFVSNANLAQTEDAFDINLRAGLKRENFNIEFFITNLLDEDAPTSATSFSDLSFAVRTMPGSFFDFAREGTQIGLRPRRQFGGRVTFNF